MVLLFVFSFAASTPVLEMEVESVLSARRARTNAYTIPVKNTGDSFAKNVTFTVETLWDTERNEVFPSFVDIAPGGYVNFTIRVRPPYEGDYPATFRTQILQGAHDEKKVTISVAIEDKPIVVQNQTEPVKETLPEPALIDNQTMPNLTANITLLRIQSENLKKHASPASRALLDRADAYLELADLAQTGGDFSACEASLSKADTLIAQAVELEYSGGLDPRVLYFLITAFLLSVAYVFKMELTGQEAFYHWKKLLKFLRERFWRRQ